ncbi:hypothetical protein HCZ18_06895 [Limosilactobacillus fermentum]
MAMKDHQYCYSEKLNESSTSHLQIGVDKVTTALAFIGVTNYKHTAMTATPCGRSLAADHSMSN